MVARTVSAFGGLDILVNNAGVGVFRPVAELTVEEFDRMWEINVRAVFVATRAALPHLRKSRNGAVVNIASLAGKNTFAGGAGYAATKWALRGFAGCLMLEVRNEHIRVVTICPGSVDTTFSSGGRRGEHIPQPEDVADAVLFAVTAPRRTMISEIDIRPTRPA
jgi:NADP-dependent 3-hydroxy acid dehydrogenase YdfG